MITQKKGEAEATLNQLAINIQQGHRHCIESLRGLISQAKVIGQWLEEARKLVPHGYWQAWVRDNCRFTPRMAQKYMQVARHYDALVSRFNTDDEWTLAEFFALAAEMEGEAKKARAKDTGITADRTISEKKAPQDAFRLEKRELRKKQKEVEKRKQSGGLAIEKDERVLAFLNEQRERLLRAIKRFACFKEVRGIAGDLDPVKLAILLLETVKAQLDVDGLRAQPKDADATDTSRPAQPHNRIRGHINGRQKSVA
jgi:hypothetical protein